MAFDLTCLATRNANMQVAQFGVGRRALGHDLQRHVVDHGVVAALHQQAAGDGLRRQAGGARIGQAAGQQQPQILLARR